MWSKSSNGEAVAFPAFEESGNNVILRRNFKFIEEKDEFPAHYEWEEWQMTKEQYEVYQNFETLINEQSDALVELADMISEVL